MHRFPIAPPADPHQATGERKSIERPIAVEPPIAFEFDGFGYAVIMATPADLEDFAVGFAPSERIIAGIDQFYEIEVAEIAPGYRVAGWLSED